MFLYNSLSSITYILNRVVNYLKYNLDYNNINNKPKINNIILSGNKTAQQLNLVTTQNFLDIANLADIQFNPTEIFTISTNTQMRNLSNQPAVFVYNDKGIDVTSLATIQWKDQILTVNATGLSSFNIPLTGTWKIKFVGSTLYVNQDLNIKLEACTNLGYNISENKIYFNWTDPIDVELNNTIISQWDETILVKKEGSYPSSYLDGQIIARTNRALINKNYYRDHSFVYSNIDQNKTYYYMLFSKTIGGTWNNLIANKFTSGTGLNWQQVGEFVEAGRGPELFPVGTTFIVDHPEYNTSTGISGGIAFIVLGHDEVLYVDETLHHNMCIGMSEILFDSAYDKGENMWSPTSDEKTIANKTYYINNGDSTYTKLVEGTDYNIGDDIPNNTYYEKNLDNRYYGSNNFAESNLLQWANSDGSANSWFKKQNIWDICGDLNNRNGFLKYLDKNFLSIVKDAKLITAKCSGEGGGSSIVNAKFWPLSVTQVFGIDNNYISENSILSYFLSNSVIKTKNGVSSTWWLRSPNVSNNYSVYHVTNNGELIANGEPGVKRGISLACIVGKPNRLQYWKEVQEIVRKGKGPERFPVGTIFVVDHPEYTHQDGRGLIFRVVGHDQVPAADETLQHTMCLDMVDCLFSAPSDVAELEYALTKDTTAQAVKTYYTLSGSTYTALTEGTDYDIGDSVPVASWYEKNLTGRSSFGSDNPEQNNLINWLNSSASAGSSIQPMTIWDQCGATLLNKNGFLKHIDHQFLAVVQPAKLTTAICIAEGGGNITHTAKFWSLSKTQVFGELNNGIAENVQLDYYKNGGRKIKYLMDTNTVKGWRLRSPYTEDAFSVNMILTTGISLYAYARIDSHGFSIACIIA